MEKCHGAGLLMLIIVMDNMTLTLANGSRAWSESMPDLSIAYHFWGSNPVVDWGDNLFHNTLEIFTEY